MSPIRTSVQLQDMLDGELAWRLKEIASLRSAVRANSAVSKQTSVRAAITLLYAHWEGFIKASSTYYLAYVESRFLPYHDLKSCFVVFGVKRRLTEIESAKKSDKLIAALDFIRDELGNTSKLKFESAIRTDSNLNSDVFSNIATSIGLNTKFYEPKYNMIDVSLLKRRNSIAHGEYLDIQEDGFRELASEILVLLRAYKTDIENAAALESYRK